MKKGLYAALFIIVIAGVVTGLLRWEKHRYEANTIEANLLPAPSTKILNPQLGQRIVDLHKRSLESSDRIGSLKTLSGLYHANGYLNHAWQNYRILIEIDKRNPLWYHRLATIVSGFGQLDDAVNLYRKSIELDFSYTPTRIHLGETLLKLNRYEEAKEVFLSILDTESVNSYALFGLARISLAEKEILTAKRLLESARRSNNRIGGDLLVDVYETLGETSKARALLRKVTWSSHVDTPDPWVDEIVSYCYDSFEIAMAAGKAGRSGDLPKAIQLMNKALTLDPHDHYAHDHLAKLYVLQGDTNQARLSYINCTKALPTYDQGWAGIISIEKKSGNPAEVSALIDQALTHCPNSPVINNYKGEFLLEQNRPQDAILYFNTSIRNRPHQAVGYNYLARAFLKLGQNRNALEQLQKALKAEPSNPLSLKLISIFYILARDQALAERYLQKAILSPRISEDVIVQLQTMFNNQFK